QFLISSPRSIDDTDVGAYLRQLFPDESAPSEEHVAPALEKVKALADTIPQRVVRDGPTGPTHPLSPDEDGHHSPAVLPPRTSSVAPLTATPSQGVATSRRRVASLAATLALLACAAIVLGFWARGIGKGLTPVPAAQPSVVDASVVVPVPTPA